MSDGKSAVDEFDLGATDSAKNFIETFEPQILHLIGPFHHMALVAILKAYSIFDFAHIYSKLSGAPQERICTIAAKAILESFLDKGVSRVNNND